MYLFSLESEGYESHARDANYSLKKVTRFKWVEVRIILLPFLENNKNMEMANEHFFTVN